MAGLTAIQVARFEERYCENGHQFNSLNYPRPDGQCVLCLEPEAESMIRAVKFIDINQFQAASFVRPVIMPESYVNAVLLAPG